MRDKGLFAIFGLALACLAGAGFVLLKQPLVTSTASEVAATAASKPASPTEKPKVKKAQQRRAIVRLPDRSPQPQPSAMTPIPVYQEIITVPPFPSAQKVRPGASEADLVRHFGSPDVEIFSSAGERLLYLSRSRATTVTVNNGTVAASRTDDFDPRGGSASPP